MSYLIFTPLILISFLASNSVLPRLIDWMKNKKLTAEINWRSAHKTPTPSSGGLVFLIPILLFLIVELIMFQLTSVYLVSCLSILLVAGFIDDRTDLSAPIKLVIQAFAAVLILFSRIEFDIFGYIDIDEWLAIPSSLVITFIFIAGVNAFNLIDGVDGLAGGISLISCLTFAGVFYYFGDSNYAILALLFSGAIAAFLLYNFHPAKIFMGDAGSLVLGALLMTFFFKASNYDNLTAKMLAGGAILLPILDMSRLFASRILKGKSPMKADKSHIHHLILTTYERHSKISNIIYAKHIGIILIFLAVSLLKPNHPVLIATVLSVLSYVVVGYIQSLGKKMIINRTNKELDNLENKNKFLNKDNHEKFNIHSR